VPAFGDFPPSVYDRPSDNGCLALPSALARAKMLGIRRVDLYARKSRSADRVDVCTDKDR